MSDNSLRYGNSKENYQQILFTLMNRMELLEDEMGRALALEFPVGTRVAFKRGNGTSHGVVISHYVQGYSVQLNVRFHTGKPHYVNIKDVLEIL